MQTLSAALHEAGIIPAACVMWALLWLYTCLVLRFHALYASTCRCAYISVAGPMHIYVWMHAQRVTAQHVEARHGKAQLKDGV
jgi:hypothetical protein